MSDKLRIGQYNLKKAVITNYREVGNRYEVDISNLIQTMTFIESINSPSLIGELHLADAWNLLDDENYDKTLMGEEIVKITYDDYLSHNDEAPTQTHDFLIYGVEEIVPNRQTNIMTYKLKLISVDYLWGNGITVGIYYKDQLSNVVREVFFNSYRQDIAQLFDFSTNIKQKVDEFNSKTSTNVEPSTGIVEGVIPNLSCYEAIDFLKRKSSSAKNLSSNFYFFQSRRGFYFKTHEQMIDEGKEAIISNIPERTDPKRVYIYNPASVSHSIGYELSLNEIHSLHMPKKHNVLQERSTGAMAMDVITIDVFERNVEQRRYVYDVNKISDDYFTHTDTKVRPPHTANFTEHFFGEQTKRDENTGRLIYVSDQLNVRTELLWTDKTMRPSDLYDAIIWPRVANKYFLDTQTIEIEMYGRNDLFCGDVIEIKVPNLASIEDEDNQDRNQLQLNGYWFIQSIQHMFNGPEEYKMKCVVSKDMFRTGRPPPRIEIPRYVT